ncbi:hypothetical protein FHS31_000522 [Sphingomonas vulcanisoli]|uniref:Fe-S oxidoreductase n=1 Tax=Sphingomonas vulcanisoli TaxID=1658060 RepID=A0ABX0TT22_9SPHN|nr:hypothetical protein [Sphingomonas vulcanisoli]NIJ06940.1 hypothetical protein [Sphingomonas vulcanisoli]
MKKTLLMLASLAIGTAAIGQTTPMQSAPATTNTPASTPDMAPQTTPPATDTATPPAAPAAPAPDASAMPAPATTSTPDASAMAAPAPADTSNYPVCSRTVTDKCVQKGATKKMHHK